MSAMKHYIYSLLSIAALVLMASACVKEKTDQDIDLDSRALPPLEVSYTASGSPVSSLSFTHAATLYQLDVNVNNEDLKWNLESDRDWCVVVPEQHKGPGTISIKIEANENFESRNPATLTFVAGEYRGNTISVSQSATAFIIGQPYFVAPIKEAGSFTTKVSTLPGTSWECSGSDWLQVAKGETIKVGEYDVTELTITPANNSGASRYGAVTLTAGGEKDQINVWQFGTDLQYDEDGDIFFPNDSPAQLSFKAPAFMVKDVSVPEYGKATVTENGDGTATVTISFKDNLSDCAEVRVSSVALLLSNASASIVALPALVQDYVPAHGLVTGKGLVIFAKAVADGASTADWEKNGVVTMLQDINMADVEGWEGVGSMAKPFTGSFDGGGYAVVNLKGTGAGLFNYTDGATIKNVTLGKGSVIYNNSEFPANVYVGGVVSCAKNTTISNCGFAGEMEVSAYTDAENVAVYIGGVAGWADSASTIEYGRASGKITVSCPSMSEVRCCVGGVVGLSEGTVTGSEMSGELKYSSAMKDVDLGGIQSTVISGAKVGNNTFNGNIILAGAAAQANVGGLYGSIACNKEFNFSADKSISTGSIRVNSYESGNDTYVYVGGLIGKILPGLNVTLSGYQSKCGILLNQSAALTSRYICAGGILGGCDYQDEDGAVASLKIENAESIGSISVRYGTGKNNVRHGLYGGIVGFINGPASILGCTNSGAVGAADTSKDESGEAGNARCGASSNDFNQILGGIVGYAKGGNQIIDGCANDGPVTNLHYTNRPSTSEADGMLCAQVAGGILGAFSYVKEPQDNFTVAIRSCNNSTSGQVLNFRGFSGGVVGFARNATITDCSSQGFQAASANDNAYYRGGIIGGVINSTVSDSWAKCSINSGAGGSAEAAFSGGIAGYVMGTAPVTIKNCSYNGTLKSTKSGEKPIYPGGLVSFATDKTVITNCKYGGVIQDIEITVNNVSTLSYAVGNYDASGCSISGTEYWDGKIQ